MIIKKQYNFKIFEKIFLGITYTILLINAIIFKDSLVALVSAFFGITYTFLAGKGKPVCYLFGVAGSGFYAWLSFHNALWGNLILYVGYYVPMQILGFFKWNSHLREGEKDIIKISLSNKDRITLFSITSIISAITIIVLYYIGDKNPIIDGITTIFAVSGMYLTVRRAIEQWIVWIIVNALSVIMWSLIAINGEKVYSTVTMWVVYFILAIYFYFGWKKEINSEKV